MGCVEHALPTSQELGSVVRVMPRTHNPEVKVTLVTAGESNNTHEPREEEREDVFVHTYPVHNGFASHVVRHFASTRVLEGEGEERRELKNVLRLVLLKWRQMQVVLAWVPSQPPLNTHNPEL